MIVLRRLEKKDLPFLLEVRNDESTRRFLENDSVFTLEQCEVWFEKLQHPWFIIENNNKDKVGYIRTSYFNEVGCDIHPAFRRRGYAKASYLEYLKDKSEVSLWVFHNNFARTLYEQLGFVASGLEKRIRGMLYIQMQWKRELVGNTKFKTVDI